MTQIPSRIVDEAIRRVKLNDSSLITKGQERALAARLAFYLQKDLSGWNVDCEYNRQGMGTDPKQTSAGDTKRPDIVIHRRGLLEKPDNLLYIEVKIENADTWEDKPKVKEFTSPPSRERTFQYQFGLLLSFLPKITKEWYADGRNIMDELKLPQELRERDDPL